VSDDETDDRTLYRVVTNHEEQYSIWPVTKALPHGWSEDGKQGSRAECLAYIEEVWTDMRPLSLRGVTKP
jgi:MbtH protein